MAEPMEVVLSDGRRISGITNEVMPSVEVPLLVAVHGGGYNASYFDVPGHSLLDRAVAGSVPTVALDRPGCRRSDPPAAGDQGFGRHAEILVEAIGTLWSTLDPQPPGIVLLGHSMGAAVAVHIAAARPTWPLLGLLVSGVGVEPRPEAAAALTAIPPDVMVEFTVAERALMYGAPGSYPADVVDRSAEACEPIPSNEIHEISGRWTREVPALAARVQVPVHHLMGSDDGLWIADELRVRRFAGLFTSAPRVWARVLHGGGHNLDHHHLGAAAHLNQLGFVRGPGSELYADPVTDDVSAGSRR